MNNTHQKQTMTFDGLGISPKILEILKHMRFTSPTPIQHQSIPAGIEGKDIIGIAQTGTGKTLAFGIPMIQRLMSSTGQGLILAPTRELALQADETFQKIGRSFGLRTAVLIGGASMNLQIQRIRRHPHIIIATPGRLIDHIKQKIVQLNNVKILVLDEADRMFDMGFAPQVKEILKTVPKDRQTMLFSATMPREILALATQNMRLPFRVEVAPSGTAAELVEQEIFIVKKEDKIRLLEKLLQEYDGSVLVFSRTKHGAKKICSSLRAMRHAAAEIHSNRSLFQRREALDGFKSGKYRVLVATDIAARGIDVSGIEVVVNFDLPDNPEDYIHRIGRTGRAGKIGKAISFAAPQEQMEIRKIERLMRKLILRKPLPELPAHRPEIKQAEYSERPRKIQPRQFGNQRFFDKRRS